jgi:outer membrane receptor protein involved in Fe transport
VADASIKLTNVGENTSSETKSGSDGEYAFRNVKAGSYTVVVTHPGFRTFTARDLTLIARETLRVDAQLSVGDVTQAVEVSAVAGAIATDTPVVASTLTTESVLSLPSNVRAGGSTSPYALIATLPGVQSDNGGGYSIQGGLPAQSESSVDGISITNVTGNSPNRNLFPSVESISEIKVQGVGNTAEYSAPGDITTISKGGTNTFHGAAFWYHQNRAFDSRTFNQATLPAKIGNTFGGTLGGPVLLPKLYDGRDRTFFYFTWESLRFPRQQTLTNSVPTARMKAGDFSAEGITIRDPLTGEPFPNNRIPESRFNAAARAIIPFYPTPNVGAGERFVGSNFIENRVSNIESNQWDLRIDHQIAQTHKIFGRYSTKDGTTISPNSLLLPSDTGFSDYQQAVVNYTWVLRPNLVNEFLGGISYAPSGSEFPFDGRSFMNSLNFNDIEKDIFFNALPNFSIDRLTSFSKGRPGRSVSWNTQFIDNLSWVKGPHTFKFGVDIRRLRAETNLGFTTGDNYGDYIFRGTFSGHAWADFLLGVPAETSVAVVQLDNDGSATHYRGYAQDSFRVNDRLTLDFGVRYEFQPGYKDAGLNVANFDRTVPVTGRVVLPSDPRAREFIAPATLAAVNACPGPAVGGVPCTPFVTAEEAGIPETLRKNYYTQFLPRFGFAYRMNDKTTLRGSYGLYNMALLGSVFFSLTGTVQSDVRAFNNVGSDGRPIFTLPETRPPNASGVRAASLGNFEFRTANQIDFHPPQMAQWSLTVDRQIAGSTGVRISYIGNKSTHLPWAPDINQPQPSTTFFSQRPLTDRPFPNWGLIYSRDAGANAIYNSFQVEVTRRFDRGLTYTAAYTWAKNLADNNGPAPTGFSGETGGGRVTNSLDRRADRGDVYATRRHRFVNTMVFDLPFGKGRKLLANSNRFIQAAFGGWSISSILILQSGPFLTPVMTVGDPSGTNAPRRGTQRPDRVGPASGEVENPTRDLWVDRGAFMAPGRVPGAPNQFDFNVGVRPGQDLPPIGRFGNAGVGIIQGPGTFAWNAGMRKRFYITETVNFQLEGSWTNLPNWTNLGDPNMNVADAVNFGRIFAPRGSDFGGNRTGQVSLRLQF